MRRGGATRGGEQEVDVFVSVSCRDVKKRRGERSGEIEKGQSSVARNVSFLAPTSPGTLVFRAGSASDTADALTTHCTAIGSSHHTPRREHGREIF